MSKFKEGDKVVLIGRSYPITKKGWKGTYIKINSSESLSVYINWELYTAEPLVVDRKDLELVRVFESPLYKALS